MTHSVTSLSFLRAPSELGPATAFSPKYGTLPPPLGIGIRAEESVPDLGEGGLNPLVAVVVNCEEYTDCEDIVENEFNNPEDVEGMVGVLSIREDGNSSSSIGTTIPRYHLGRYMNVFHVKGG